MWEREEKIMLRESTWTRKKVSQDLLSKDYVPVVFEETTGRLGVCLLLSVYQCRLKQISLCVQSNSQRLS